MVITPRGGQLGLITSARLRHANREIHFNETGNNIKSFLNLRPFMDKVSCCPYNEVLMSLGEPEAKTDCSGP